MSDDTSFDFSKAQNGADAVSILNNHYKDAPFTVTSVKNWEKSDNQSFKITMPGSYGDVQNGDFAARQARLKLADSGWIPKPDYSQQVQDRMDALLRHQDELKVPLTNDITLDRLDNELEQ